MRDLAAYSESFAGPLEAEMRAALDLGPTSAPQLRSMLQYHLGWVDADFEPFDAPKGKRVRPVLCLLACEACGGRWRSALPAAAAIELLHNFSLIHDDIEDGDSTRRGRPTVWSVWGVAQAINAGDAMFSLAQLSLLGLGDRGCPPATVVRAAHLFNQTCYAITEGQHLDIGFEGRRDVTVDEYLNMVQGKTAALLSAAPELGAQVAVGNPKSADGSPPGCLKRMRDFGRHLGLAFQMQDDVLGIWGEPGVTGKSAGTDLARRKKSLPILHGLEQSQELRDLLYSDSCAEVDVVRARELLDEAGSRAYAEALAKDHHERAIACLADGDLVPAPTAALRDAVGRLLQRNR